MNCIRSISFFIIIKGQPTGSFSPNRGIGQGDPLSPYILILCVEVLYGGLSGYQSSWDVDDAS